MNNILYDEYIFLSGIFTSKMQKSLIDPKKNRNIQVAADTLQKHIIAGLEKNLNRPIKLLNVPFIGASPMKCKVPYVHGSRIANMTEKHTYNIGFLNFPLIRQISIYRQICRKLDKWAGCKKKCVVIAYAMTARNVCELVHVKKHNPSVKTCLIVPDLPMHMRMKQGKIYKFFKFFEIKLIKRNLKKIDSYVLLTEYMNEFVNSENYCVVEGVASSKEFSTIQHVIKDEREKIIFYSGTLDEKYGILILLEAFMRMKEENYRLYICGQGDCQKKVLDAERKDKRINYLGQKSHEEVLKYQQGATLLVNPRQNIGEFTRYSFPSKNLEYLSSGIPMVAYKLDGIPKEYDKYILYINENTVDSMKEKMEEVLKYSDEKREKIGLDARRFVLSEKSDVAQTKKILDMISNL